MKSPFAGRLAPNPRCMLSTAELIQRPSRPPDYAAENRELVALAREMATSPEGILQKLADTALTLCRAHSAGLSILEDGDQKQNFHWRAIAGQWAAHVNGGTPRGFGPCGTVLDRNVAMVCSHPELDFPYWASVKPVLEEALLIPFHINGEAVGTIWVVAHDTSRRFDGEDLRVMTNLGNFTAAAYQAWLTAHATQRVAAIVESSDDAIVSKNLDGIIMSWNRGAERLFGYSADEMIGKSVLLLIPADRHNEEPEILGRIRRGERIEHYETVRLRKDGSLIDISLSVSPIKGADGKVIGASKIARDISERKRAQARQEMLTRELNHRTKNLFAVVQSVVSRSFAGKQTVKDAETAVKNRLRSLAETHALLVEKDWQGADLAAVVRTEMSPYPDRVTMDGPTLMLSAQAAQNFALAVHELATNAAKYGALSNQTGWVHIRWSVLQANGASQFTFRWQEQDGPPVEPPTIKGFGAVVLEQVMSEYFDVAPKIEFAPSGVCYELKGSLEAVTMRLH